MRLLLSSLAMLSVLCCTANADVPLEFQGIHRLKMHVSSGDVKVIGVVGDTASVEVVKKRYDERCQLTLEQHGDLLFVELASKKLFDARCEADFTVKVPKIVNLKFKDGAGDISVEGTSGAMAVVTGSGHVNVKAKLSAFRARTGSGNLFVEGLEKSATVRTGSGKVKLVYERAPSEGQLEIQSGSGNAEVVFPKQTKLQTRFNAGSGSMKNLLGETRGAKFTLLMNSGSGDLLVGRF